MKIMRILLFFCIFAYIFCKTEIYNITFSEGVEINKRDERNFAPKPIFCTESNDFYLRLKLDDLNNSFSIKFKLDKSNNFDFKEVKAFGFKSYPSDEELTEDKTYPLVNTLKGEFSHDTKYEYYTYAFLAPKNFEYASISIYIKNRNCEYIGISASSEQN